MRNEHIESILYDELYSDEYIGISKIELYRIIDSQLTDSNYPKLTKTEKKWISEKYDGFYFARLNHKNEPIITTNTPILGKLRRELQLDFDETTFIVNLTTDNVDKIINYIKTDNSYIPFARYIFERFKLSFGNIVDIQRNRDNSLLAILIEIDRDNSTQVWRYRYKRDAMLKFIEFILNEDNEFFERLKNGDSILVDDIINYCGTTLVSFASKACTQLFEYMFMENGHGNKFYKNDKFVRAVLPYYLDYYGVEHRFHNKNVSNTIKYSELHDYLDKLRYAAEQRHGAIITREGLDQILWYCYKSFSA